MATSPLPAEEAGEPPRFRIDTIAEGRLMSRHAIDGPEQAMETFAALARTDFGRHLGPGSYMALVDYDGELDALRIAEGRGAYGMQFVGSGARAAFEGIGLSSTAPAQAVDGPAAAREAAAKTLEGAASPQTSAGNEISAHVPLAADDAATARLRRAAIDALDDVQPQRTRNARTASAGDSIGGKDKDPVARATIARMGEDELRAYLRARGKGVDEPDKVLAAARKRIEHLAEGAHRQTALPPLDDRFNVVDRRGSRLYESRAEPGRIMFVEGWLSLRTTTDSPAAVKGMVDRAAERGWKAIDIAGSGEFRRQVWIAAQARGIPANGHEPTAEDRRLARQEETRLDWTRSRMDARRDAPAAAPTEQTRQPTRDVPGTRTGSASVMRALEHMMAAKGVPEAQREKAREAVRREIEALGERGKGAKVKVFDPAASRLQRPPQPAQKQRTDRERSI